MEFLGCDGIVSGSWRYLVGKLSGITESDDLWANDNLPRWSKWPGQLRDSSCSQMKHYVLYAASRPSNPRFLPSPLFTGTGVRDYPRRWELVARRAESARIYSALPRRKFVPCLYLSQREKRGGCREKKRGLQNLLNVLTKSRGNEPSLRAAGMAYKSARGIECFRNNNASEEIVNKCLETVDSRKDCPRISNLLGMLFNQSEIKVYFFYLKEIETILICKSYK